MASTEFATRSHKGAGFLLFLGLFLVAAGLGFAFAPEYSWQVTKIARQANGLGLQNGVLVVGGLVTLGLAIVVRSSSSGSVAYDPRPEIEALQSELHVNNEQLTTKLAQLRSSLLQVNESISTVGSQQQTQMQNESPQQSDSGNSQEALFRLAASLDKLHAHLDERIHAVDLQLRSGFETLLNSTHEVRRHLEQGGFGSPTHAQVGQAPHAAHASHQASPVGQSHSHPPEGGIDFFQTMQKLEAIAGGDVEQPANKPQGHHPHAPFPSQGNVDSLDALLPEEYRDRY